MRARVRASDAVSYASDVIDLRDTRDDMRLFCGAATRQTKFMELAKTEGNPNTITRHEFQEALSYVGIQESDQEILDRLFTMFDKMGDNQVTLQLSTRVPPSGSSSAARFSVTQINFREFIVGISPLAKGTVQVRVAAAVLYAPRELLGHAVKSCSHRGRRCQSTRPAGVTVLLPRACVTAG